MFGWVGRRMLRSTLKGYGIKDEEVKGVVKMLAQAANAPKAGSNQASQGLIQAPLGANPADSRSYSSADQVEETEDAADYVPNVSYQGDGGGDLVLARYYDMLGQSKTAAGIDKWGQLINQRETYLGRSAQGRKGKQAQMSKGKERSAALESLDLSNLAPSADLISGEIIDGWLSKTGLLPEALAETAKSKLAGVIKEHPDIVKKGLDTLDSVLRKYAPKKEGAAASTGPKTEGGFDATSPETWPGMMQKGIWSGG